MTVAEARALVVALLGEIAPDASGALAGAGDGTLLHEDLGLDSVDLLELVERVAARTGVRVPEREFCELETVGRLSRYLAAA